MAGSLLKSECRLENLTNIIFYPSALTSVTDFSCATSALWKSEVYQSYFSSNFFYLTKSKQFYTTIKSAVGTVVSISLANSKIQRYVPPGSLPNFFPSLVVPVILILATSKKSFISLSYSRDK